MIPTEKSRDSKKKKTVQRDAFATLCTLEQRLAKSVPRCNYWGGGRITSLNTFPHVFHLGFFAVKKKDIT